MNQKDVEAFRSFICGDEGKSAETARKYISGLAGAEAWAESRGLVFGADGLSGLDIAELYAIRNRLSSKMDAQYRTAVSRYMDHRLSLEPEETPVTELGLSELFEDIQLARRATASGAAQLLMRAMLLDPEYKLNRNKRTDLERGGAEYPLYRSVILSNMEKRPAELGKALGEALESLDGSGEELRDFLADVADRLAARPELGAAPAMRVKLMQGWRSSFATGSRNDLGDWYAPLGADCMREHMMDCLLGLVAQLLGARPPEPKLSREDVMLVVLLAPFSRALTVEFCRDTSLRGNARLARLLELGYMRVERVPYSGTSRVVASGRLEVGDAQAQQLAAAVWSDAESVVLLDELVRRLETAQELADERLLPEGELFAIAPELVAMLADAPAEQDAPDASEREERRIAKLVSAALKGGSPAAEAERILAGIKTAETARQTVERLVNVLVKCHRKRISDGATPESLESAARLISLYYSRPRAVTRAFGQLEGSALMELDEGENLLIALLHRSRAVHALELAEDAQHPAAQREIWVNTAQNSGREGFEAACRLGDYAFALDCGLVMLRALALHADMDAGTKAGCGAVDLLNDYVLPCVRMTERILQLLDEELPQQLLAAEAFGAPLPEGTPEAGRARLAETLEYCRVKLLAADSDAARVLKSDERLGASLPQSFEKPGLWTEQLPNELRATPLRGSPAPAVLKRAQTKLKAYSPWYCSYLDSSLTKRKGYRSERVEAYMLKTLLSAQNIVMTVNQAMDNANVRSLAHTHGFLQMLRSGHVCVSFYSDFSSLLETAACQMESGTYIWSSLSPEFNANREERLRSARFFRGELRAEELAAESRTGIVIMKEQLTLMDENLPIGGKLLHYQRPERSGKNPSLAQRLDSFFDLRRSSREHADICRAHTLLRMRVDADGDWKKVNRSVYQDLIGELRTGVFSCGELTAEQLRWAQKLCWDESGLRLLDELQEVLDDCQNRMYGGYCSDNQHHVYTEEQRIVLPQDEATPINRAGMRLFRDTVRYTETGAGQDWTQAAGIVGETERRIELSPGLRAEDIAAALSGGSLAYSASEDGQLLSLGRAELITSRGRSVAVEETERYDAIHMETEGE